MIPGFFQIRSTLPGSQANRPFFPDAGALRILHIVESASAGVGRHVADLALEQSRVGHCVHVLYSPVRMDARFKGKINNATALGELRSQAIPMAHGLRVLDAGVVARVRRYAHDHGPFEVIHGHSTKAGLISRMCAAGSRAVSVYTPHAPLTMDATKSKFVHQLCALYERTLSRMTDVLIAVSEDELEHLVEIGIDRDLIVTVPNGIEPAETSGNRARLRREFHLAAETVCIGFVGRLVPQKNASFLLACYARICPNLRKHAALLIVGEGPMRAALEKQAEQLGISEQVQWAAADRGQDLMTVFDVFALPSLYEGFPYVLLEALRAGLPIVASRVGGVRATVRHGVNGFVSAPKDRDTFAGHLEQLIRDPSERARQGQSARERVKEFTLAGMARQTVAAYTKFARTRRAPQPELHVSAKQRLTVEGSRR